MNIPTIVLGVVCGLSGLMLTFVLPIQRGRFRNQIWDLITLALFVAGAYWIHYWVPFENVVVGLIVGGAAILIRDFRLWVVRFQSTAARRGHRYYYYGRARDWYQDRRRR